LFEKQQKRNQNKQGLYKQVMALSIMMI